MPRPQGSNRGPTRGGCGQVIAVYAGMAVCAATMFALAWWSR